ncbi:MAG: CrcB family protein [Lacisediminihabitans sp.]
MKPVRSADPTRPRWFRVALPWHRSRMLLPVNSDIEVARSVAGVSVMIRIRPSYLALAALGGALGTAARFGLTSIAPSWETLSAGTVVVNILGPFLLGMLLQFLSEGTESKRRRALQLMMGVGFLGAFTSYAQLAVDTVTVTEHGHILLGVAYAAATIAAGALAAWLGIVTASHRHRRVHG